MPSLGKICIGKQKGCDKSLFSRSQHFGLGPPAGGVKVDNDPISCANAWSPNTANRFGIPSSLSNLFSDTSTEFKARERDREL